MSAFGSASVIRRLSARCPVCPKRKRSAPALGERCHRSLACEGGCVRKLTPNLYDYSRLLISAAHVRRHSVDEQTTLSNHFLAKGKPLDDLNHVPVREASLDRSKLDRLVVMSHPDVCISALVHLGITGHCGRRGSLTGKDAHVREHFRLEPSFRVIDGGTH